MSDNHQKNIVICSDGTGNSDVKGRGSNVFKLYEAVDIQGHKTDGNKIRQIAFYDDGVGTSDDPFKKLLGAAFGYGFSKNVQELYRELVRVYKLGDQIYLFGFSRGAYTVRTLAGFIQYCGILDRNHFSTNSDLEEAIEKCWYDFKGNTFEKRTIRQAVSKEAGNAERIEAKRKEDGERRNKALVLINEDLAPNGEIPIEFIGVWDTVAAVGSPFRGLTEWLPIWFKDLTLGYTVLKACHALSIDDERLTFLPELWNEFPEPNDELNDPRVEQVWFAGVHSNVGGGYPKHGMSMDTLDWMMTKANIHGLRFNQEAMDYVNTARDVHGELYDSRAGFGKYYRWQPRDIFKLCKESNIGKPKIHVSVFERLAQGTDGYAPGNIPFNCEIVNHSAWPVNPPDLFKAQTEFSDQGKLKATGKNSLLEKDNIERTISRGRKIYYFSLFITGFLLINIFPLLVALIRGFILKQELIAILMSETTFFLSIPVILFVPVAVIALIAIWLVTRNIITKNLLDEYSKFWSDHRDNGLSLRGELRKLDF